jgi:nitrate reductase NapAB chaperone NapD
MSSATQWESNPDSPVSQWSQIFSGVIYHKERMFSALQRLLPAFAVCEIQVHASTKLQTAT